MMVNLLMYHAEMMNLKLYTLEIFLDSKIHTLLLDINRQNELDKVVYDIHKVYEMDKV